MKDNYCVIMGGGIGSRFWPFSRESYPKQFLDFFGTGRSLLQMTFDRFSKIIPIENIYIVTNEQYASLVKEQLPELGKSQILLEPARRNTAPCIAYAAYHIKACNPNANIVVAPSDHLILKEDIFLKDVQKSLDFVKDNKVFMESGEFFWNSGLFVWNVNTILEAFSKFLPDISLRFDLGKEKFNTAEERDFIAENFPYCLNISIDYGIMEKADNVYMLCVDFGWADLGTWGSLFDLAKKDEQNNALLKSEAIMYESNGNIVALDNPKRLTVIQGINDCIVAESGNVLLICKKEDEQRIKQFVADAQMKYGKEFN